MKISRSYLFFGFASIVGLALTSPRAEAYTVSAGTPGTGLAATAEFLNVGGSLQVTLSNVGGEVANPSAVLTALFFDVLVGGTLTPASGTLFGGSTVFFDPDGQPAGGVIGGEYAYGSGLAGAPHGATEGISSAGFGLFGAANFPGANLDDPVAVDGLNYGLLSAVDDTTAGNAAVIGNIPLIKNAVQFLLTDALGLAVLDDTNVTNVSFQYGTALTEPNIVPIPPAVWLLGSGLLALIGIGRRNTRRTRVAA